MTAAEQQEDAANDRLDFSLRDLLRLGQEALTGKERRQGMVREMVALGGKAPKADVVPGPILAGMRRKAKLREAKQRRNVRPGGALGRLFPFLTGLSFFPGAANDARHVQGAQAGRPAGNAKEIGGACACICLWLLWCIFIPAHVYRAWRGAAG